MISSRFTTRVLLVTVLPVVITAFILASILISERIDEFNKRINEKGNNIASYLSPISEYGVFSNSFSYLDSTLTHTLTQPDIVAVYIRDDSGSILLQKSGNQSKQIDLQNPGDANYKTFTSVIRKTSIEIDDPHGEFERISGGSVSVGSVSVVMDLSNANVVRFRIVREGIVITLILTMATILVALLFSRSVTRPITDIQVGVNIIKKGDLHYRIPVKFSGELAELARGINNMTSSLEFAQLKEKQRAEDVLYIEKTKAQITLESIGEGVITTDIHGQVTYLNPAAENLTGFATEHALNKPLSDIFKIKKEDDDVLTDYPILDCINKSIKIHHESGYILNCTDGTEYAIRETAAPLLDKDDNVVGAVLVFHDFTNIKKMSDVLVHQATHDDLTGLLNRRAFEAKMHDIIDDISANEAHALCYIDLDRFKIVNDTCGHLAGDNLLKLISSKINGHIRKNDLFARLGGDEFGVIFFNCDTEKALSLAEEIKTIVSEIKFSWGRYTFNVGSSIGIVPITYGESMSDLMVTVDTACYVAKNKGRNRIHIYEKNDEDVLQREGELQWFQAINKALEDDSFVLYSQKMVPYSKQAGSEIHEILIRLNKDGKIIEPGTFIPAAERYSLMAKIDMWVVKTLLKEINDYKHLQDIACFSINLSGQTLTDDVFVKFLHDELDRSRISPGKLIFEITETAAISNFNEATNFIRQFKQRGCKFALDDFGSGMSSFQYLGDLPIDYLKIDGSFVKHVNTNPYNQSVIKSISQIGHSLGLDVVAEFVENEDILAALDKSQIDYVQGYAIERPHPLIEQQ